MTKDPKSWEREYIVHTHWCGGHLWLYDKVDQMSSLMGNWYRMDVQEQQKDPYVNQDSTTKIYLRQSYRFCIFFYPK